MNWKRSIRTTALLGCVMLWSIGCQNTQEANCTDTSVDGEPYCVASGPIIETGFDCPSAMPHRHRQGDLVICSEQEGVPEEHRREIGNNYGDGEYSPDDLSNGDAQAVTKTELCGNPGNYEGTRISVSTNAVELMTASSQMSCSRQPACCNSQRSLFVVACGDGPNDLQNAVVLRAAAGTNFPEAVPRSEAVPMGPSGVETESPKTFGCAGQQCYQVCTPGRLSQLDAFEGTFRSNGPFTVAEHPGGPDFGMKLDVDGVDYAGDGCPDFASGCPSGCNEITGKKLYRDQGCMAADSQVIGCTSASADGDVACVKRDNTQDAHLYRIPGSSTADGTDWVACSSQEESDVMGNPPVCQ